MPPNDLISKFGKKLPDKAVDKFKIVKPTLVVWTRLEPVPYNEDLTAALQAQVADPLWFLTRQWQVAEFQAEDAGTPIRSKLTGDFGRLSRYRPVNAAAAVDYDHRTMPLEVLVERERIQNRHPLLSAQAGEHLLRLIASEGIDVTRARAVLREEFPLDIEDANLTAAEADPKGQTWQRLFAGRAVDGSKLAEELSADTNSDGQLEGLPDSLLGFQNSGAAEVIAATNSWLLWYSEHVSEPTTDLNEAWIPERQEYRLTMSARMDDEEVIIAADEYTDGRLDWYSFKVDPSLASLGTQDELAKATQFEPQNRLPAPVRYPGMPADRYWEFEDARVNLGRLEAGPTDLGRMLLAEFGLVFSNDWFLIPVEVPVGSLFRVDSLEVTDTFGVKSSVKPARNFDGSRWTMFTLTGVEGLSEAVRDLFFLPPTIPYRLESEPLEEIALIRDEMANMAWAIERIVQGASGVAMDRRSEPPNPLLQQGVDAADVDAELIYRLMTPVADYWLPLLPVQDDKGVVNLKRHVLSHTLLNGVQVEVHPRGILLRTDLRRAVEEEPAIVLFEEEVTRDDTKVSRTAQYTRWFGGTRFLWVGRKKGSITSSSRSGLRFDRAIRAK